jgi:mRNA interferase MazF
MGQQPRVRIPRSIANEARIAEGDLLSLDLADDGSIVLRSTRRTFRLDQLVSKITPKNRHKETAWGARWPRSLVKLAYVPEAGDLVWLDFNPQDGREQARRRPALILSPQSYNRKSGLALVCPITSRSKGYPFEVLPPDRFAVSGVILADHVKSVDWAARHATKIASCPPAPIEDVVGKLAALLGY